MCDGLSNSLQTVGRRRVAKKLYLCQVSVNRFKLRVVQRFAIGLTMTALLPTPILRGSDVQAATVFRIVLKGGAPGPSRAVSTTVRTAASPSAAHIAR